jgi:signal transduction histidine kinase
MVIAIDRNLPAVRVSTAAVREILDVLGSNAAQHGGGVVTLRARDTGGGVALEVSDEGRGVEGDIERIFQRRSRSSGGHGIGLVLARSLAEAEGGRLVLKRSGDHPTFALLLLATDEAPDDERAASAA